MIGGHVHIGAFDPTKKLDWLNADITGFVYTAIFVGIALAALVGGSYALVTSLNRLTLTALLFGGSAVIAFVIVFCLRKNLAVMGEPRKFRYLCRWL